MVLQDCSGLSPHQFVAIILAGTTIAAKPHPKSACQLQRSLARGKISSSRGRSSELDSMTIRRSNAKLSHAPRLAFRCGRSGCATISELRIKPVDIVDGYICHVRVIPEFRRGTFIGAFAEHDAELISRKKTPAVGAVAEVTLATEHANPVARRYAEVANCKDKSGADQAWHLCAPK